MTANLFRPSESSWAPAWGDRVLPDGYGADAIELGQHFDLQCLGACLLRVQPGHRSGPLHYHLGEEEVFVVLEGTLTARELHPGADDYVEYELGPGSVVVYPPATRVAHQSVNRSDAPVTYLALSDRWQTGEVAVYPDSGKTLVRGVGALGVFEGDPPIAEARAIADARSVRSIDPPDHAVTALPERELSAGVFGRALSRAGGATRVFVNRDRLDPGAVSGPLHFHTSDEELAVVLSGTPVVRQLRDGVEEQVQLQPGDVVAWKPGDQVGHHLHGPGDFLVIGTHRDDDVTVFPETGRLHVRRLQRTGRVQSASYWDGEQIR